MRFNYSALKNIRKKAGMSQADVMRGLQVLGCKATTRQAVNNWECGANAPSGLALFCLCKLFGVGPEMFYK